MKRRIRQNVWGNWYGYLGRRRVEAFSNSPEHSAEDAARHWLATGESILTSSPFRKGDFLVTFRRTPV